MKSCIVELELLDKRHISVKRLRVVVPVPRLSADVVGLPACLDRLLPLHIHADGSKAFKRLFGFFILLRHFAG